VTCENHLIVVSATNSGLWFVPVFLWQETALRCIQATYLKTCDFVDWASLAPNASFYLLVFRVNVKTVRKLDVCTSLCCKKQLCVYVCERETTEGLSKRSLLGPACRVVANWIYRPVAPPLRLLQSLRRAAFFLALFTASSWVERTLGQRWEGLTTCVSHAFKRDPRCMAARHKIKLL
jgi:hypothetical protein